MSHIPVLLSETLNYLNVTKGRKFVDGTAGSGGHLSAILLANPLSEAIGIDLDQASLDNLQTEIVQKGLSQRAQLVQGNYRNIDKILKERNIELVDGILLDLGFSSSQLDDPVRGFSFQAESALDMRYDRNSTLTAEKVVNSYHDRELEEVISKFGEEKFARRIAANIIRDRKVQPIKTTTQLAEIIRLSLPAPVRYKANESFRRVFQALRIEVNSELENLKTFLPKAMPLLNPGGRLCIISFHSLEDRIVKNFFLNEAKGCTCPPEFPVCICNKFSNARILTRKPVTASVEETEKNSRSRAAKLRAIEKVLNKN
jgi:16S rRNA (cytosine1402-N4)-methyltransferase